MLGIARMMLISSIAWWGRAVGADRDAAVRAADLHVEVGVGDGDADLVRGAARRERAVGREERDLAHRREPGGDAAHVLLGDADLDEALRERSAKKCTMVDSLRSPTSTTMRGSCSPRSTSARPKPSRVFFISTFSGSVMVATLTVGRLRASRPRDHSA
jgi:hypothetical protein